jgi:hypothetical protein
MLADAVERRSDRGGRAEEKAPEIRTITTSGSVARLAS